MLVRPSGIIARIVFVLCGVLSILLGKDYWSLQIFRSALGASWLFSVVMIAAGGFVVVVALLPSRWMRSASRIERDNQRCLQLPFRVLAAFAAASFLMTAALIFAPHGWHPSPQLVFAICPACALTITVDPSPVSALLILAPLSAAVYGAFGGALGYIFIWLRDRTDGAR
jgi:hypothetical protein